MSLLCSPISFLSVVDFVTQLRLIIGHQHGQRRQAHFVMVKWRSHAIEINVHVQEINKGRVMKRQLNMNMYSSLWV